MGALAFVDILGLGTSQELATQRGERCTITGVDVSVTPVTRLPLALFVDPQNVTGFANDNNTGQTANNVPAGSGPIRTTAENNTRMVNRLLTADTTITYLSEDLGTVGVNFGTLNYNGFQLVFDLPIIDVFVGTTITGVTPIDPTAASGGQRERLQVADFTDWTPFVFSGHGLGGTSPVPLRIVDLTRDCAAWIMSQETGEVTFGHLSRPVNDAMTASPQFQVGDSYKIVRPGRLPIEAAPTGVASSGGSVTFNNCQIHATGNTASAPTTFSNPTPDFNHCSFDGPLLFGGNLDDCYMSDGAQGIFLATTAAGGWLPNGLTDQLQGILNITGDTYFTGDAALSFGASFYFGMFVSSFGALGFIAGSGVQVQSVSSTLPGISLLVGASILVAGGVWGNGNTGPGMQISAGATFPTGVGVIPNITGAGGDVVGDLGGAALTTARFFDTATGVYSAPIAASWANYAAAQPAGFGQQMHWVEINAHVVEL
jgi:hypothetical protein